MQNSRSARPTGQGLPSGSPGLSVRDDKDTTEIETLDAIKDRYQRQSKSAQAYQK